jgi:hypothetical protein
LPRTRFFAAGQILLLIPLSACERRMRRTGGPGIIPFELAGTPERSRKIMDTWGPRGQSAARVSLLLDYPYLVTYAGLQVAGCRWASTRLRSTGASALADAGRLVAPLQVAAGAFDAAENTTLLAILAGRDGRLPGLARFFASVKFGLLGLGWLYQGAGFVSRFR